MKILFHIHSLCVGGAETVVTNYLLTLKRQGQDVVLVVNERQESFLQALLDDNGIRTISILPQNTYSILGKVKRIIARITINFLERWNMIILEENPDIIHLHTTVAFLDNCNNHRADRIVYTFHSDVERNLSIYGEKHQANLRRMASEGMSFFCLSNQAEEDVRRIFKTTRTACIPNGVDMERIRTQRYDREAFLRQLDIPTDSFVIGHVGRFHPVKNHPKLLEIFTEVLRRRPNAYLVLVGTGEARYMKQIKDSARALGVSDHVVFLGLRSDSTQIMGAFDAVVIPSLSESFSLALVEAQTLGIRSVSSDVVPREVVCNDNCFALNLNESAQTWADYVLGTFLEPKTANLEQFDMKNIVSVLVEQYALLLRQR